MSTQARTTQQDEVTTDHKGMVARASQARPTAQRRRIWSVLHREEKDDGVFRPVRLPLWMDLGISAAIIVIVLGSFAGFIVFLARTQGR